MTLELSVLTPDQVASVLPLAHEFEAAIGSPIVQVRDDAFVANWRRYIELNVGIILLARDQDTGRPIGVLSGYVVPSDRSGQMVAQETWFYVTPEARGQGVGRVLATVFEAAARDRGAVWVSLGHLHHLQGSEKLFEKLGYKPFESTWFKVLS